MASPSFPLLFPVTAAQWSADNSPVVVTFAFALDVNVFHDDMTIVAFVDSRKYLDSESAKSICSLSVIWRVTGKRGGNDTVLLLL